MAKAMIKKKRKAKVEDSIITVLRPLPAKYKKVRHKLRAKGTVISMLNKPVTIKYKNEDIVLSPRAKINNIVFELLGTLPTNVLFKRSR